MRRRCDHVRIIDGHVMGSRAYEIALAFEAKGYDSGEVAGRHEVKRQVADSEGCA